MCARQRGKSSALSTMGWRSTRSPWSCRTLVSPACCGGPSNAPVCPRHGSPVRLSRRVPRPEGCCWRPRWRPDKTPCKSGMLCCPTQTSIFDARSASKPLRDADGGDASYRFVGPSGARGPLLGPSNAGLRPSTRRWSRIDPLPPSSARPSVHSSKSLLAGGYWRRWAGTGSGSRCFSRDGGGRRVAEIGSSKPWRTGARQGWGTGFLSWRRWGNSEILLPEHRISTAN